MEALLDACAVSYLFQAGQKEFIRGAAHVSRIHFVLEVVEELKKETTWGKGFEKLLAELSASGHCEVHELLVGSPEQRYFNSLRANSTSPKDQGEHASIALAVYRPDLVFVSEDDGAIRRAVVELPGFPARVTRTAAWLRFVDEQGGKLDRDGLARWTTLMMEKEKKAKKPVLPRWWASWLGGSVASS